MNKVPVAPRWELKFGKVQVLLLSVVFSGGFAVCFYLGFSAGRTVGHDQAQARSLAASPRLPINGSSDDDAIDSQSKDIYAALQEVPEIRPLAEPKRDAASAALDKDIPELASLPSISVSDIESNATHSLSDALGEPSLQGAKAAGNSKTLADLAETTSKKADSGVAPTGAGSLPSSDTSKNNDRFASVPKEDEIKPLLDNSAALKAEAVKAEALKAEALKKEEKARIEQEKKEQAEKRELFALKKDEAKKSEIKKDETKEVKSKTAGGSWYAQVAAPESLVDATAMTKKLRASGFSASVENANVRGQNYYRILVGPEDTKDQGERLLQQLKRESYLTGAPFLRFVK